MKFKQRVHHKQTETENVNFVLLLSSLSFFSKGSSYPIYCMQCEWKFLQVLSEWKDLPLVLIQLERGTTNTSVIENSFKQLY